MRGKDHITILLVVIGVGALAWGVGAEARSGDDGERWIPNESHHRAAERGETCSLLRSLADRTRRELEASRDSLTKQMTILRTRREAVESCGRERGILTVLGDREEGMLAEVCGSPYAAWIDQGYQLEMVRQDLKQATGSLQWLMERLQFDCPKPAQAAPSRPASPLTTGKGEAKARPPRRKMNVAWLRGSELPR